MTRVRYWEERSTELMNELTNSIANVSLDKLKTITLPVLLRVTKYHRRLARRAAAARAKLRDAQDKLKESHVKSHP